MILPFAGDYFRIDFSSNLHVFSEFPPRDHSLRFSGHPSRHRKIDDFANPQKSTQMAESIDLWAPKVGFWAKNPPHPAGVQSVIELRMKSAKCGLKSAPLPPRPPKNPHRAAVRPRRVGLGDKLLSNFADHLSANYLWMMFCRLSSVGCLLFLFFCCLSVVYLVELYVFWVIRGNRGNQKFHFGSLRKFIVFLALIFDGFFIDFGSILDPFWLDFASFLHSFFEHRF